ncbi:MAG: DUF3788 domain-containing protein [Clostridiaceae bacterium]|nr:DUF3788 domain-containing protein [Clostridiaceae bacterium]
MEWHELFPQEKQPDMEQISEYIGGSAAKLWDSLIDYMDKAYKAKPKMTYSVCSGKPGWNIKFQKSGKSFGTLYPEKGSFSVFLVVSYKLDPLMEAILPMLTPETAELYSNAGDYMKMGKWMMFRISDESGVQDYKKICEVKLPVKAS